MIQQHIFSLTRRYVLSSLGILGVGLLGNGTMFAFNDSKTGGTSSSSLPTGYVYDPIFLKHNQSWHPENARRLEAIMQELETSGLLASLQQIPARAATLEELAYVHPVQHVNRIKAICQAGGGNLDPDTYTNVDTYDAAATAAGGMIDLTLAVLDGKIKNGFAFVRPPGHHALASRSMGFCIFNNIAIAARAAQQQRGLQRIAIIDFDVHHGNGTQAIFEEDPNVLYISTHQYPHYPGTGGAQEIGRGAGQGTIINFPLPSGVGDRGFQAIYTEAIIPAVRRFQPQLILVSAGYDCHWSDPLAGLGLSLTGMAWISQTLVKLAEEVCEGKIVFTLEGGYNLEVLSVGVANGMKALMGRDDFTDPPGTSPRREPDLTEFIEQIKQIHGLE